MSTVRLESLGRFGNLLFQVSHALKFCELGGHELRMPEWVGERIFTLDGYKPKRPDGTEDIVLSGYFQNQESLIYSRADCRRWFALRPEIQTIAWKFFWPGPVVHYRRGDYAAAGYPLISRKSVRAAMVQIGINETAIEVSDEGPKDTLYFPAELSFVPDFLTLMQAPLLFRANSSFSWWAGVLGHGKVFSPVITGLAGGVEHDEVPFVEGNHSRLAELPGITELHLREK